MYRYAQCMPLTYYVVQTKFVVDTGVKDSISIGMCKGHDIFQYLEKKIFRLLFIIFFKKFFVLNGLCEAVFSFLSKDITLAIIQLKCHL